MDLDPADNWIALPIQSVTQGWPKPVCFNLKSVAILATKTIHKTHGRRAEHVDVNIPRLAKLPVFEMVMFEICEAM